MRKNNLFLFAVLVAVCIFAACSGKGSSEDINIVGRWKYKGVTSDVVTSDQLATNKIKSFILETSGRVDSEPVVEFTADGKMNNGTGTEGSYTVEGNKVTVQADGISGTTTFNIKGDSLVVLEDITDMCNNDILKNQIGIAEDVKVEKAVITGYFLKQE